jgi:hypothetical protein
LKEEKFVRIIYCKCLTHKTTGEEIYRATTKYLQQGGLSWKICISVCTDGATAMAGNVKGFNSRIRGQNQNVHTTHCFLHREALVAKTLTKALSDVLDRAVDRVNFIKARQFKSCLFSNLCEEMGAEHQSLLLHTAAGWLSRGKCLDQLHELRKELGCIYAENTAYKEFIVDAYWCAKLLNIWWPIYLRTSKKENRLSSSDKLHGLQV